MGGFSFILHINHGGIVIVTLEYKLLSLKSPRGPNWTFPCTKVCM